MMKYADSIETILNAIRRLGAVVFSLLPALFGLFMILWGVFLNDGDMILIIAGLLIFLIFGYGTYRALMGKED
jgi:hypothetical protein